MALVIAGLTVEAPAASSESARDVFKQLSGSFKCPEKVVDYLVDTAGMERLEDFATYLAAVDQVHDKIIKHIASKRRTRGL